MKDTLMIEGDMALIFPPLQVQTIIQALNEIPYKLASPVIDNIYAQCKEQMDSKAKLMAERAIGQPSKGNGQLTEGAQADGHSDQSS